MVLGPGMDGTHSAGSAKTVTYRAQWFDRLMNLGPLGDAGKLCGDGLG